MEKNIELGMIIFEILAWFFVDILLGSVFLGIYKFIKKLIEFVRVKIFGMKPKPIKPKKLLAQKLLYKKIELIEDLNSELKIGQEGTVLELINKKKVFAEFYDQNGKQIELNNELVFEIGIEQFKLKE